MLENRIKIISGGQTGVDRGALDAALELGVACGGWCPRGRKAEDGKIDLRYPLKETQTADYIKRTKLNVKDSDATLIIYFSVLEGGSARTQDYCLQLSRPCLLLDMSLHDIGTAILMVEDFVLQHHVKLLNVAGPRASKQPEASDVTKQLIVSFLEKYTASL